MRNWEDHFVCSVGNYLEASNGCGGGGVYLFTPIA